MNLNPIFGAPLRFPAAAQCGLQPILEGCSFRWPVLELVNVLLQLNHGCLKLQTSEVSADMGVARGITDLRTSLLELRAERAAGPSLAGQNWGASKRECLLH